MNNFKQIDFLVIMFTVVLFILGLTIIFLFLHIHNQKRTNNMIEPKGKAK